MTESGGSGTDRMFITVPALVKRCGGCVYWTKGIHAGRCGYMRTIPGAWRWPVLDAVCTADHVCPKWQAKAAYSPQGEGK